MYRPVIAARKDVMSAPGCGKLQPLLLADGSPIEDVRREFPKAGDIFVFREFDAIPDELLEVRYEANQRPADPDSPFHCKYAVGRADWCKVTDRFYDLVEADAFPDGALQVPFKPTTYFFVRHRQSQVVRGPYKRGVVSRSTSGWVVPIVGIAPSEGIAANVRALGEHFLLEFPPGIMGHAGLITCEGLFGLQLDCDRRVLLAADRLWALARDRLTRLVDAMSAEDTLTWVRSLVEKRRDVDRREIRRFKELVLGIREHVVIPPGLSTDLFEARIERAVECLDQADLVAEALDGLEGSLLERYKATAEGGGFLERYVREREPQLVAHLKDEAAKEEGRALDGYRSRIEQEMARLEKQKSTLDLELLDLQAQIQTRRKEATLAAELDAEFAQIRREIEEARKEKERLEATNNDLAAATRSLEDLLTGTDAKLKERLAEFKTFVDMLSGVQPRAERPTSPSFALSPAERQPPTPGECVERARACLRSWGRNLSTSQTANFLVSILQSRVSILLGFPGVGKTSMIELLAAALGLQPGADASRLLKVNVGRGWVSSRDLIGVYNPLLREFQPSDTGLYYALEALDDDWRSGKPPVPLWVLLDEMNLSPVEHYWSEFLAQTDDDRGAVRAGGRHLRFGPELRFIGTVNYDDTTETLSPRLISRAQVIVMDPPEVRNLTHDEDERLPPPEPFSLEALRPLWHVPDAELNDAEVLALKEIADLLRAPAADGKSLGRPIHIDARVNKSVVQYCAAARELIGPDKGALGALDFAIAQRVLPQCRGSGEGFRDRLLRLQEKCRAKGLTVSGHSISRMLSTGEAYHEYDFFAF